MHALVEEFDKKDGTENSEKLFKIIIYDVFQTRCAATCGKNLFHI
jgi:hypothetical protein